MIFEKLFPKNIFRSLLFLKSFQKICPWRANFLKWCPVPCPPGGSGGLRPPGISVNYPCLASAAAVPCPRALPPIFFRRNFFVGIFFVGIFSSKFWIRFTAVIAVLTAVSQSQYYCRGQGTSSLLMRQRHINTWMLNPTTCLGMLTALGNHTQVRPYLGFLFFRAILKVKVWFFSLLKIDVTPNID